MKAIFTSGVLLFLFSCGKEPRINPDKLTSLEYGSLQGLSGRVAKLTLYLQKQVFQPFFPSSKTCEAPITAAEWSALTQLFDQNKFKKVKAGEEQICYDAGSDWIIARSSKGEIKAVWGPCTGGDPSAIQPLVNALFEKRKAFSSTCN